MLKNKRDQPQYWRGRAEHALTDAKSASDLAVKAKLLGVAKAYEIIAQHTAKRGYAGRRGVSLAFDRARLHRPPAPALGEPVARF